MSYRISLKSYEREEYDHGDKKYSLADDVEMKDTEQSRVLVTEMSCLRETY